MTAVTSAAAFRQGLEHGELRVQACDACGAVQAPARYACSRCRGTSLQWRKASGRGTVYATTRVARAPSEEFRPLAPYTLAIVELDEGARLMGHAPADIAIGDRVAARAFRFGARTLVRFERSV
jgi:uncharacterized OB-fold protein